jgi:hypothetical protein
MRAKRVVFPIGLLTLILWVGWCATRYAVAAVTVPPTHFKCYLMQDPAPMYQNKPIIVEADDQFHIRDRIEIGVARFLCTPLLKKTALNGPSLPDTGDHLKCYAIKSRSPKRSVNLYDQFGPTQNKVAVGEASLFCAPAAKDF